MILTRVGYQPKYIRNVSKNVLFDFIWEKKIVIDEGMEFYCKVVNGAKENQMVFVLKSSIQLKIHNIHHLKHFQISITLHTLSLNVNFVNDATSIVMVTESWVCMKCWIYWHQYFSSRGVGSTDLYLIKDSKLQRESCAAYLISYAVGNIHQSTEYSSDTSSTVQIIKILDGDDHCSLESLQSVVREHWSSLPASWTLTLTVWPAR